MFEQIRVAVVDSHPMFCAGIARVLTTVGKCEIVAEGAGTEDAFRIARECAPDVLILDLDPESSVDTVRQLASQSPCVRTMILTVIADEHQVVATLRAGAAAYMLKGASGTELAEGVRRVHGGECYVYPSLAAKLIGGAAQRQTTPDRFSSLTVREDQILEQLTKGLSNKEIGRRLDLSDKTVKHYMTALLEKLDARNRVEAAVMGQGRASRRDVAKGELSESW
jgi:two-component system, NarL family, nitrate/nitrite response regulator NarL